MRKFCFILAALLVAAALLACVINIVRHETGPGPHQQKAAEHKPADRNPAVMDPALTEFLLSPTPTPEVKGTFDQKSRTDSTPSPL